MADHPLHSLRPLHPIIRDHLEALAGPLGTWQHATGTAPNQQFGYCTDDVARVLAVDLLHLPALGWRAVRASAWRSLRFLSDAFDPATGSFRNFRAGDGTWLDSVGSEDSQGRAALALGAALGQLPEAPAAALARTLFVGGLPAMRRLTALRATASALLGCEAALDAGVGGDTERTFDECASRLHDAFAPSALEAGWPWPEPVLTYENALLPRALLAAGARLGDDDLRRTALRVLDWLVRVQTAPDGSFSPIGSNGWWPRGGVRSRFDQQPIEATAMILAAEAAFNETGEERYRRVAEGAYSWYLGANAVGVPVAVPASGGCHDGLTPRGVNLNQGAESTLMWLTALEHVRGMRAAGVAFSAGRDRAPMTFFAGAPS